MVNFINSTIRVMDLKKDDFKDDKIVISLSKNEGFNPKITYKFRTPDLKDEVKEIIGLNEIVKVLVIHNMIERILPENFIFPDWNKLWTTFLQFTSSGSRGEDKWQIMETAENGETVINAIAISSGRPMVMIAIYPLRDVVYFFVDDYQKEFPYGNFGRNIVFKRLAQEIKDVYSNKYGEYGSAIARINIEAYKAFAKVIKEEVEIKDFRNKKLFKTEEEFIEALMSELNG